MGESHLNIARSELAKMDLGALVRKSVLFHDPVAETTVWEYEFEKATVQKTEWYGEAQHREATNAELLDSEGHRWGNGQKIASTPMHIWAREIVPRVRDGNDKSIKKFFNEGAGKAFRTFKGNI